MSKPLYFIFKDTVDSDKHRLVEIFFKDWLDNLSDNQVSYDIKKVINWHPNYKHHKIFHVMFDKQEDAVVMKLRGVPKEFQSYLEMVNLESTV